jgi:hypothetical protein
MSNINVPINVEDNRSLRSNINSNNKPNTLLTNQDDNKSVYSKTSQQQAITDAKSAYSKKLNPFEEQGNFIFN